MMAVWVTSWNKPNSACTQPEMASAAMASHQSKDDRIRRRSRMSTSRSFARRKISKAAQSNRSALAVESSAIKKKGNTQSHMAGPCGVRLSFKKTRSQTAIPSSASRKKSETVKYGSKLVSETGSPAAEKVRK
jgi:hypothetical protein